MAMMAMTMMVIVIMAGRLIYSAMAQTPYFFDQSTTFMRHPAYFLLPILIHQALGAKIKAHTRKYVSFTRPSLLKVKK